MIIGPEKTIALTPDQIKGVSNFYDGKVVKTAAPAMPAAPEVAPAPVTPEVPAQPVAPEAEVVQEQVQDPVAGPTTFADGADTNVNMFDVPTPEAAPAMPEAPAQPEIPADSAVNIFDAQAEPVVANTPAMPEAPAQPEVVENSMANMFDVPTPEAAPVMPETPAAPEEVDTNNMFDTPVEAEVPTNSAADLFNDANTQIAPEADVQEAPTVEASVSLEDELEAFEKDLLNLYVRFADLKVKVAERTQTPKENTMHM